MLLMASAAVVTFGLISLMRGLIAEEFTPQDKQQFVDVDINAKPDDIELIAERKPPKHPAPIDVPPPPPTVYIPDTDRPAEPISKPHTPITDIHTDILPTEVKLVVADSDPRPINRIAPPMPTRATRSGHCRLIFNIGPDGRPYDVRATSCSQSHFERPAVRSVEKWIYRPEIKDGLAISRAGVSTTIRFNLTDESGRIIPE